MYQLIQVDGVLSASNLSNKSNSDFIFSLYFVYGIEIERF
jgi:hypothetical protein